MGAKKWEEEISDPEHLKEPNVIDIFGVEVWPNDHQWVETHAMPHGNRHEYFPIPDCIWVIVYEVIRLFCLFFFISFKAEKHLPLFLIGQVIQTFELRNKYSRCTDYSELGPVHFYPFFLLFFRQFRVWYRSIWIYLVFSAVLENVAHASCYSLSTLRFSLAGFTQANTLLMILLINRTVFWNHALLIFGCFLKADQTATGKPLLIVIRVIIDIAPFGRNSVFYHLALFLFTGILFSEKSRALRVDVAFGVEEAPIRVDAGLLNR